MKRFVAALLMILCLLAVRMVAQTVPLRRTYEAGERIVYAMTGLNESPQRTIRYAAHVSGVVRRTADGTMVEDLGWNDLQVNGTAFPLSPASEEFRETLSLDAHYKLAVPDLSQVQPVLIGPITDLLTFYADVQLAMRQSGLRHGGDHVYVKHGLPNSWADGRFTLLGQDSIDFDLSLVSVDRTTHVATLVARHVPPAEPQVKLPAQWMVDPVGGARNNWVQVQKLGDGRYAASVGEESFEADIRLSVVTGKIVSATLDNPVEVMERDCTDEALEHCAAPVRYKILRQIKLEAE